MTSKIQQNPGSYRDPDGFVFTRDEILYRHVAASAREDFEHLISSGLYEELASEGLLVPHEEEPEPERLSPGAWKVLRPRPVAFLSWPYEWSFSQLRAAALLTLDIARRALAKGMVLKDASAYNIQFVGSAPVFIDTLSFTRWEENTPWAGYRQFCEHFLAPLALAARRHPALLRLQRSYTDGVPLEVAGRTLPFSTRLQPGLLSHIHLHARFQNRHADTAEAPPRKQTTLSRRGLEGILDNLQAVTRKLEIRERGSHWAGYYAKTNYSSAAFDEKKRLVREYLAETAPELVWDMGANTGVFSEIASEIAPVVVAIEADEAASDAHFRERVAARNSRVLPLVMDLANPSPDLGWNQSERPGLRARGPADCVLALALAHHLAIGANLPLGHIAAAFKEWGRSLIIEFVPKSDSQTQRLLASREDIFPDYDEEHFRATFAQYFEIIASEKLTDSERTLYFMRRKEAEA